MFPCLESEQVSVFVAVAAIAILALPPFLRVLPEIWDKWMDTYFSMVTYGLRAYREGSACHRFTIAALGLWKCCTENQGTLILWHESMLLSIRSKWEDLWR